MKFGNLKTEKTGMANISLKGWNSPIAPNQNPKSSMNIVTSETCG